MREILGKNMALLITSFFIGSVSIAQDIDSTSYYRKVFKDDENICNGQRQKAYDYLKKNISKGMKYKTVMRNLPAEYHISKDKTEAELILLTRCGVDEESYHSMATYLILNFSDGKLVNFREMNYG